MIYKIYKLSFYKDARSIEEIGMSVDLNDKDLLAHYEVDARSKESNISDLSGNNYDINYYNIWFEEYYSYSIYSLCSQKCRKSKRVEKNI